ncbi:DNA cytosine methyltransferase [Biformimicrobium ophioploci]|uniref:DNA (cytosine-5-)-methyltransferase n=1 Tax=Biformimicrobium ophioploci TaxID=3036711 RepID=A0ABQ6LW06_9GAMM|nr:DNA cytosine methyltransferase [Microbulbifer sp. NKW57]GMG86268.1 DNA cytosine methyltransferase [Microbulbifer sp. NKW57]
MSSPIKVIDLFAGPGGLGEGFSAYRSGKKNPFKIAISIEKEASAHRTLTLRSLFRQFGPSKAPEEYYAFMRGELGKNPEDELYKVPSLQDAVEAARNEAQQLTLGETSARTVYSKIRESLKGHDCILIGGPPCQAYSLVGRSRNYGAKDKKYSAQDDHRNFLYKEYLKIIAKFQPLIFVMENVKGMLSAKVGNAPIFPTIMSDLKNPCRAVSTTPDGKKKEHRYKIFSFVPEAGAGDLFDMEQEPISHDSLLPRDFVINAERYGIPQARHRVILLGIREDIASELSFLKPLDESSPHVDVRSVISDLPRLRSKLSKGKDSLENWRDAVAGFSKKKINSLRKNRSLNQEVIENFYLNLESISQSNLNFGAEKGLKRSKLCENLPDELAAWYQDERLGAYVTNHESRGHIRADLHRYMYYSTHARHLGESPNSKTLPKELWPNHQNFGSGKFADRFRVQIKDRPGTTVTSHISKDGHYFIHYDPLQCRSLTVREAARIQTFPDNYHFVGNRTEQYVQVGNAVPPYLARQLADVVYKILR